MADNELQDALDAARGGDADAIAALFRAVHPRLIRFIRAHEQNAADDIAGEVWMAVASGLATFDGDLLHFRAWIFSIARRRLADHRRRHARQPAAPVIGADLDQLAGLDDPETSTIEHISGEAAARLIVALLPSDQADVVLLRVLAGLDVNEVAEMLGRTANWVRVTGHRGLRRLAARLGTKIDVMP